MKTEDLIRHFADRTTLPVDVNDVLTVLRENGNEDEVEFIGVEFDTDILQGKIKIFYARPRPYADPVRFANIYYHKEHDSDWQRFICCKELMHLVDPEGAHTKTTEEIERLAAKVGLPADMQDPESDGWAANVDRNAEFRAAAILLPWDARQLLLSPLADHKLSIDDIARMADIPRRYASFVMSAWWEGVHSVLTR